MANKPIDYIYANNCTYLLMFEQISSNKKKYSREVTGHMVHD